jgi:serine/threonine protein kinase
MSNFPDFSNHGYHVLQELGHNLTGGRVTYLAKRISPNSEGVNVVIKQFQFAQLGSSWAEYETYEQEIKMLQRLNHPGIPRYLDSFQTHEGFCMVQEYIDAKSLSELRSWTPQQIKQLALSVLEILAYLQDRTPPVIHRDIKPENILIDEQMNVYLVDFGFARMGDGEVAMSSVIKGTLGFMPPEQLFNRQLSAASDLYGLGVTLVCLLTGTKSVDVGNLIDSSYQLHFRHLVPPLQRGWLNWLEKMVEPRPQDRYLNAAAAIAALEPINVSRLPKARLERNSLEFTASEYGEKLTQTISISNPIPDTVLTGRWQVAPHPSDPPHTPHNHAWISFYPEKFEGNLVDCKITLDTSKLLANETYQREILLFSNSSPEAHKITVQLQTYPLTAIPKPHSKLIILQFFWHLWLFLAILLSFFFFVYGVNTPSFSRFLQVSAFLLPLVFLLLEFGSKPVVNNLKHKGFNKKDATFVALLSAGLGFSVIPWAILLLRFIMQSQFIEPIEMVLVGGVAIAQIIGLPFLLNYYLNTKRTRLLAQYRRQQPYLIKP